MKFKEVDLAIGDLAQDIYKYKSFPMKTSNHDELLFYLKDYGACQDALKTFEEIFKFYTNSILEEESSR